MLSSTYTIRDVKVRLEQEYGDYGFSSSADMTSALLVSSEDVQYLYLYPIMGSSAYDILKDKDKIDLTEKEMYLYLAEVHYICSVFTARRAASESASNSNASSEKLTVEGYTYESTERSGTSSSFSTAIKDYLEKAFHYMAIAGYNPYNLQRGGGVYGESNSETSYGETV